MGEAINSIDRAFFKFINQTSANPLFDAVMPFVTDQDRWVLPLILIALAALVFGGKRTRLIVLGAAIVVGLSDWISSGLLKPLVGRIRPCHELYGINVLVNCAGKYSFPSGHAANTFALATWFGYHYRNRKPLLIALVVLVGYSRIYVGVHWTLDVAAGMLLGYVIAKLATWVWIVAGRWYKIRKEAAELAVPEAETTQITAPAGKD